MTSSSRITAWGNLTLEVPATFEDETIVILRAPAPPIGLRLPKNPPPRPSFVCKRTALGPEAPSLAALGAVEERTLLQMIAGATIHGRAIETLGGRETLILEASYDSPMGRMRQVHATTVIGEIACSFVGTAMDNLDFPSVRQQLLDLVASVKLSI